MKRILKTATAIAILFSFMGFTGCTAGGGTQKAGGESTSGTETASADATTAAVSDTTSEKHLYDTYYERNPDLAYSEEEWFNDEGCLWYPFDLQQAAETITTEEFAKYYVPDSALEKAGTAELLEVVKNWPQIFYYAFANPYDAYYYIIDNFNAADELAGRDDLAAALAESYIQEELVEYDEQLRADLENAGVYDSEQEYEARQRDSGIATQELFLAMDYVYSGLDDDMRVKVIEKAVEIEKQRMSGDYYCFRSSSAFFAMAVQQKYTADGYWYDYIMKNYADDTDVQSYIENCADEWQDLAVYF